MSSTKEPVPYLFSQWLEKQKKHALKWKDINSMPVGTSIQLAVFDRNVEDAIDYALKKGSLQQNRPYLIRTILEKCDQVGVFTKGKGRVGVFDLQGTVVDNFVFDRLNEKQGMWLPIKKAPAAAPDPDSVVGYRGYAIPMSLISPKDKARIVDDGDWGFL